MPATCSLVGVLPSGPPSWIASPMCRLMRRATSREKILYRSAARLGDANRARHREDVPVDAVGTGEEMHTSIIDALHHRKALVVGIDGVAIDGALALEPLERGDVRWCEARGPGDTSVASHLITT